MRGREGHRYACETEHDVTDTCVVPTGTCGECGHLLSQHLLGYGCGVEVNGDLCKCETGQ